MNTKAWYRARATALRSAVKNAWRSAVDDPSDTFSTPSYSLPDLQKQNLPAQFHDLIDVLTALRRRTIANRFLRLWAILWLGVLCGLIMAGLFVTSERSSLSIAAVLLVIGAAAVYGWIWRGRESLYQAAWVLDSAAGLKDRLSTALFFANAKESSAFLSQQRTDALGRVARIDVPSLFPIRLPRAARSVAVLMVIAATVFVYRAYHQAPMLALLQVSERSHLLQRVFQSPEVKALADQKTEEPAVQQANEDLWQPVVTADDQPPQDASDQAAVETQEVSSQPQSLTKSMMQALKNMVQGNSAQQPNDKGQNQQNPSQKDSQANKSAQGDSSEKGNQTESSDKTDGEHKSPGAGDKLRTPQPMVKNTVKSSDPSVKIVTQRVALQSETLKDQPRTKADAELGTAQLATRNISPQAMAVINSPEPDDIPARYRVYVQRYFEHTDDKQQ
jgi:hypothetical protein